MIMKIDKTGIMLNKVVKIFTISNLLWCINAAYANGLLPVTDSAASQTKPAIFMAQKPRAVNLVAFEKGLIADASKAQNIYIQNLMIKD